MAEPSQHFYESQRLRLSYWAWGDPARQPMIMIHGLRDHSRSWDRIAQAFSDRYYVVTPDLRGHGASEWARGANYELNEFVPDLVTLIDLLGGRVTSIGHSMGGRAMMLTAGAFPERFERIVGIEATGREAGPLRHGPRQLRAWAEEAHASEHRIPRVYPSIEIAAERVREVNPRLTVEWSEHLARWGARPVEGGFMWKYDPWSFTLSDLPVRPEEYPEFWANTIVPVLHIIGSEGVARRRLRDGRPIESFFPDARTTLIDDAGHWVHHDQPAEVIAVITEFLGDAPPRPTRD